MTDRVKISSKRDPWGLGCHIYKLGLRVEHRRERMSKCSVICEVCSDTKGLGCLSVHRHVPTCFTYQTQLSSHKSAARQHTQPQAASSPSRPLTLTSSKFSTSSTADWLSHTSLQSFPRSWIAKTFNLSHLSCNDNAEDKEKLSVVLIPATGDPSCNYIHTKYPKKSMQVGCFQE